MEQRNSTYVESEMVWNLYIFNIFQQAFRVTRPCMLCMLCMLCQVVAVLAPSHGQIPLYRRSARGISGMWWSHVKSCEVKETCGEQEIRSEQVWTTLSCNNDWQSISIYATMCLVKQFLWANVWQIYWIPLALSWHFCDFCLLLGHNASIEKSWWKFWIWVSTGVGR